MATESDKKTDSKTHYKLQNMYPRLKMKLKKYETIIGDSVDGTKETVIREMNDLHHSIVCVRLDENRETHYSNNFKFKFKSCQRDSCI